VSHSGPTHARLHPDEPTDGPARCGSPPNRASHLGDGTLLVALAAGLGGACLLVVVILVIIRSRRARATGPAPGLRTLLVGE
jgi:hypothetical protein